MKRTVVLSILALFYAGAPQVSAALPAAQKDFTFGVRAAYNNSFTGGYTAVRNDLIRNADGIVLTTTEYRNKFGGGHGFEFGAAGQIALPHPSFRLAPSASIVYRRPVIISEVFEISELALTVGATTRWELSNSGVFVGAGFEIARPLITTLNWKILKREEYAITGSERLPFDSGIIIETGYTITGNVTIDLRTIYGLSHFNKESGKALFQTSVGICYIFVRDASPSTIPFIIP